MITTPFVRLRRIRENPIMRDLVADTFISPSQFIFPVFVVEGENLELSVEEMLGVNVYSIDMLGKVIDRALSCGVRSFMLFPRVDESKKSDNAEEAYNPDNLICRAVRGLRERFSSEIVIITDVAADPYTISGHDGLLQNGKILNDETLELLAKQALVQVAAGSDMIAPSDMMDGRILAIRNALDLGNLSSVPILSYSVKYASKLYKPFRSAIGVNKGPIDKRSYQVDCRNSGEAMREIEVDIAEGADIVMIKPANLFLDVIGKAVDQFSVPIFAYQVSGEYQMFRQYGGIEMLIESLIGIKRAGVSSICTYAAIEVAEYLKP
ncbi:delta-aminolevulinic acid dehydratase family protein [Neorickettsia helminthoeca str. Oregon]|uniref:Delta-aminolevulinic acid dehydratase n=1 Tax=Neorickettsia helminthoeca str. Oregon TaxID=1286528 RepID=X5HLN3_9RICK|nr:porphobilinogen synthase [Neorickettsia helminthoeca]AHX11325.1 delta-aminolevulinic acid dehydratase family protein [Neorickettsia helminthoeca str. Oregon]